MFMEAVGPFYYTIFFIENCVIKISTEKDESDYSGVSGPVFFLDVGSRSSQY